MTSLVLTLAFKESPLLHLEALQYPLSHRFTILHQWRLVTLLPCWSELARVVRNVDWDHNLQRYISNDEVGLSTVLSKRWSYGGLGERNATYIGTLLFEAKKNEVNICELGSLPIGVWVGCWWGLDECQCQDWVVPTISVSHVYIYQGFSFNCALALVLFLKISDTTYGNDFIAARSCEMIVVWSPVSSTRSPKWYCKASSSLLFSTYSSISTTILE